MKKKILKYLSFKLPVLSYYFYSSRFNIKILEKHLFKNLDAFPTQGQIYKVKVLFLVLFSFTVSAFVSSLRYCFYPELQERLNSSSEVLISSAEYFLFVFQQRVAFTISLLRHDG